MKGIDGARDSTCVGAGDTASRSRPPERYSLSDLPPGRCRVIVFWEGREFLAARVVHPKSKRLVWCVMRGSDIEYLPLRGWASEAPEWWRPADDQWTWPGGRVPKPLPETIRPQMVSASGGRGGGKRWSSMAEQAARSARIEAELEAEMAMLEARPVAGTDAGRRVGSHWWKDPTLVSDSPAGEIDLAEAEGRIMRAILTDGVRPVHRSSAMRGVAAGIAAIVAETITSAETAIGPARWEASPRDVADHEIAMAWFAGLSPPSTWMKGRQAFDLSQGQRVLVHHALGDSWRRIAGALTVSAARAHEIYHGGKRNVGMIEKVWRVANGQPALPHLYRERDEIAALRERNRAFKRGQG